MLSEPLLTMPDQPLSRYGLVKDLEQAFDIPRFPINIVKCVDCGLVYNSSFASDSVDYTTQAVTESTVFSDIHMEHQLHIAERLKRSLDLAGRIVVS